MGFKRSLGSHVCCLDMTQALRSCAFNNTHGYLFLLLSHSMSSLQVAGSCRSLNHHSVLVIVNPPSTSKQPSQTHLCKLGHKLVLCVKWVRLERIVWELAQLARFSSGMAALRNAFVSFYLETVVISQIPAWSVHLLLSH